MQPERRLCLAASAALPLSMLIDGCTTTILVGSTSINAIVDANYSGVNGAQVDAVVTHKTLQNALTAATPKFDHL